MSKDEKKVAFIQYDLPALKAGKYTIQVEQALNTEAPNQFAHASTIIVKGERLSFSADDISGVFPPNLATGEFDGVLPHVVLKRCTLPWERASDLPSEEAPWLAVFLFTDEEAASVKIAKATPLALLPQGQIMQQQDTTLSKKENILNQNGEHFQGTLPAGYLSYPDWALEYGESPDDACMVIDIPVELFSKVAPAKEDLPYLAHIRQVDTMHGPDSNQHLLKYAIVRGNRVPAIDTLSHAFLVSLERFAEYLPDEQGAKSGKIPADTTYIRLLNYHYWRFTANSRGAMLRTLLENLNKTTDGRQKLTTLQVPFEGIPPTESEVKSALDKQQAGTTTAQDARVLLRNALVQGYVPLKHHLRHGGETVSWYRGPLAPSTVMPTLKTPLSGPDAANAYNPLTGLFDVSYGIAWQLGQMLALQNTGFANELYRWRRTTHFSQALSAQMQAFEANLNGESIFSSFLQAHRQFAATIPDEVSQWLARLRLLYGIPFHYLVPDERMLPIESLRFFFLDQNWLQALIDGVLSIGRVTRDGRPQLDCCDYTEFHGKIAARIHTIRPNRRPFTTYRNETQQCTGFLLRSKVVAGWPNLQVNGYADQKGTEEIPILRWTKLSEDTMLCLFDGVVALVALHEPPEQIHAGVEGDPGHYTTTLRAVTAGQKQPGQQLDGQTALPTRSDNQTLKLDVAQRTLKETLNNPPFDQKLDKVTSAEFALELVKGVVKVEYYNRNV
ncbi:hypothetical protein EI42_03701 [Thermosporothrix hazakensis]|jgi:hypothetical protein|uniref:Uncharacterized protein n=2 Tax=Thermosporothrix TaxID=768650 RepID=A0A326U3W9_THEHA|nr:hypothetical protein [Thermosporothrix hazakensis]PZW27138.1 hypothetical protein EI42_03701 [Thermosporothrix hazakensis]BBH88006.1 hypothetical protein KTC_27570 [Thermosporothrix sp. COM3]GCE50423.1 hypothetical protein KTH_52920 [Thermosporothrix hazakensis]